MFLNKFALTLKVLHKPPSYGELFSLLRYFLDSRAGIADQRRIQSLMTIDIELTLDHYVQICALRLRQVTVGGFYSLLSLPIDFRFLFVFRALAQLPPNSMISSDKAILMWTP